MVFIKDGDRAAYEGLPMSHIPPAAFMGWAGAPSLSPYDAAEQTVRLFSNLSQAARAVYVDALVHLGHASRRRTSGERPTAMQRANAMKSLNRARTACRRAEAAEAAARADLATLDLPHPLFRSAA